MGNTRFKSRIETRLAALSEFPHRGSPRDDLSAGLRTPAFKRRVLIAYTVNGTVVTLQRIINASRDLAPVLQNP
ncbi:type II toxin-antitoxin system RelE/ParE family toxin [Novosphingobium sp. PY1]|uniref:type II toxin-antitoxin system RelE/ParE family toxin n=1 Tax=Novosphingobium sp. PY1 TaxID=1882221 RepID=UPI001A8CB90F|nr:type II toxin-antitoxin system RelE/ParE family toxin [Novosphingobium sp. PY1]